MIAKHHEDRWTKLVSNWNPAVSTRQTGYRKQGRPAKRWEDDLDINLQTDRIQQMQERSHERHDPALYSGRQLDMGCDGK